MRRSLWAALALALTACSDSTTPPSGDRSSPPRT